MEPLIYHFFIFLFTRLPSSSGASHKSFFCIFGFYNISLFPSFTTVSLFAITNCCCHHLSPFFFFFALVPSRLVSSRHLLSSSLFTLLSFCLVFFFLCSYFNFSSLLISPYPSNLSFLNLLLIPPPLSSSLFTFLFISAYRDDDRRAFPTSLETRSIRQHNPKRSVRSASY